MPVFSVVSSNEDSTSAQPVRDPGKDRPATSGQRSIIVDYPEDGSIFPPEITPPTFLWRDADSSAKSWRIDVTFGDGSRPIHAVSQGAPMQIGEVDTRCISTSNKLPTLTSEQAAAHTWKPETETWEFIKRHSVKRPTVVAFTGLDEAGRAVGNGQVTLSTSRDPVGAPIFYRDVPLMPSEGAKHVVQPLAPSAISLINWRMRDISKPESRIVMRDVHTCANCHSFSADGKAMGLDMDGPGNDKGLYAVVPVQKHMAIRNQDMITWNQDMRVGRSRVGFMSQISPDGRYVLTTFAGLDRDISDSYFVKNFKDYRFLQVFYPTRGILTWYDRTTGARAPLPGADDPSTSRPMACGALMADSSSLLAPRPAKRIRPNPFRLRPMIRTKSRFSMTSTGFRSTTARAASLFPSQAPTTMA